MVSSDAYFSRPVLATLQKYGWNITAIISTTNSAQAKDVLVKALKDNNVDVSNKADYDLSRASTDSEYTKRFFDSLKETARGKWKFLFIFHLHILNIIIYFFELELFSRDWIIGNWSCLTRVFLVKFSKEGNCFHSSADLEVQLVQLNHCDGEYSNY